MTSKLVRRLGYTGGHNAALPGGCWCVDEPAKVTSCLLLLLTPLPGRETALDHNKTKISYNTSTANRGVGRIAVDLPGYPEHVPVQKHIKTWHSLINADYIFPASKK